MSQFQVFQSVSLLHLPYSSNVDQQDPYLLNLVDIQYHSCFPVTTAAVCCSGCRVAHPAALRFPPFLAGEVPIIVMLVLPAILRPSACRDFHAAVLFARSP